LLDTALVSLLGSCAALAVSGAGWADERDLFAAFIAAVVAALALYEVCSIATKGATLGKRLVGIKVERAGGQVGYLRSIIRLLVLTGAPLPLLGVPSLVQNFYVIAVLLPIVYRGRGIHDYVAGTVIARSSRLGSSAGPHGFPARY
jgi:uncharacterized RDD family membrane protein YckC